MDTLMRLKYLLGFGFGILSIAACSPDSGFTLDGDTATFEQSVTEIQTKVDILWVVDNSGSMETSQTNVAANFQSFIDKFQQKKFDFQIAVTTTEAWLANPAHSADPSYDPSASRFRDGNDTAGATGVTIIKPDTPNLNQVFIDNIQQGIAGDGDERGWDSLKQALSLQANLDEPFPRQDALLAIIILTDEDDFSHDDYNNVQGLAQPYDYPGLHDPLDYYNFLFDLTGSSEGNLNFMVNTIAIQDQECLTELTAGGWTGRKIAQRYAAVTEATNGFKGSLCDDFSDVLGDITDLITEKSTSFKLNRQPAIESIVVTVNGSIVPMDSENGWSYNPDNMLLTFHGSAVPEAGATLTIDFAPAELK